MTGNGRVRRGGRLVDESGRAVTWSVAEGRRGRRWRWTVADKAGNAVVAHTLETDPDGRFTSLESATGTGLLTLHREADDSVHGNRVTGRGIDHLVVPAPAPGRAILGASPLAVAALVSGLRSSAGGLAFDVLEVLDDLGVQVVRVAIEADSDGTWEIRLGKQVRRQLLDDHGLPADETAAGRSWPLEGE